MKRQSGFTLIELMIVVAVVAILASVALPSYQDYIMRGRIADATTMLSDLKIQMEHYFGNNRTYDKPSFCTTPPGMDDWTIACSNLGGTTFTLTATGKGAAAGFSYTIDQDGTQASVTKWTSGNQTCWIMKKGGAC